MGKNQDVQEPENGPTCSIHCLLIKDFIKIEYYEIPKSISSTDPLAADVATAAAATAVKLGRLQQQQHGLPAVRVWRIRIPAPTTDVAKW